MYKNALLILVLVYSTLYLPLANAITPNTFSIRNLNPFILVYGLPATEPAELKLNHKNATAITLDIANNSMITSSGNEAISLDGETYRLAYTYRHGLSHNTEIGLEIPFIAHSRGFMDNFIEAWHDLFGLTNNERNKTTDNKLNYQYSRDDIPVLTIASANEGVGDIRLFAARQLFRNGAGALSLHAAVKLPTGDAARLHGSGATDVSISLAHMKRRWLSAMKLSTFANGGVLFLGKGDVLSDRQKNSLAFGSTGLIWNNGETIDLKAQLDFHSRVYDSRLDQLGAHTLQLTIGGSIHLTPSTRVDIGVGENLFTDTTPDFIISLAIKD